MKASVGHNPTVSGEKEVTFLAKLSGHLSPSFRLGAGSLPCIHRPEAIGHTQNS